MKITNEIITAFLECDYKSYLILKGGCSKKTEYEDLMHGLALDYRTDAASSLLAKYRTSSHTDSITLSEKDFKNKHDILLGANIETDSFALHFDALKKQDDKSTGRGQYMPVLFLFEEQVREKHKLFLSIMGFMVGHFQNCQMKNGIIVYSKEKNIRTLNIAGFQNRARNAVNKMTQMFEGKLVPNQRHLSGHCKSCEFQALCLEEAKKNDSLSLLSGIKDKEIVKLNKKGIFTVNQLSYTFRPRKKSKRSTNAFKRRPFSPALKALAIREKKIHVHEIPTLPKSTTTVFFDIEGVPSESLYYLIGVSVVSDHFSKQFQFWANSKEEEIGIFIQFLEMLSEFDDFVLFHFGSYETRAIKQISKRLDKDYKESAVNVLKSCFNLLSVLSANVYLPVYSNGLKDVGEFLGYEWKIPDSSGLQSIVWRKKWEITGNDTYKTNLLTYNMDDVQALIRVKDFISSIENGSFSNSLSENAVVNVDTLPKKSYLKFVTKEFAFPEIEEIKNFAYFDYQREKVHVRTNENIKRQIARKCAPRKNEYRPNKSVVLTARVCPRCKSRDLTVLLTLSKKVIDLRFFKYGVKRWITRYDSFRYCCKVCGNTFLPEKYRKIELKYGHRLISWILYQHIVNKESIRQIETNLDELFCLKIPKTTIHYFKTYLSKQYKVTFDKIKNRLLKGDVLYVDETPLVMKHDAGYAWVFTNLHDAISIYKPSREGEFLKEYLADFSGIMISDFYSAYDSIDCFQQKCLLHFIRDFNDDLLKNPFDEEFKGMAKQFTDLLKNIVDTIDRHGLKRRFLGKHKKKADNFIKNVLCNEYNSETAQKYQSRILRNKDKLFLFLEYDDVSWNNGNAEHAIKLLATHTNDNLKYFNSKHIEEYLILMSIYQTCKYRNVSFLDFLLSEEMDVEKHCARKPKKR